MSENITNNWKWWQRPQPAWVTVSISVFVMAFMVVGFSLIQSVTAESLNLETYALSSLTNTTTHYQGFVTDVNGDPVDGNYNFEFAFYPAISGGTAVFSETHSNVPISNGAFNVVFGSKTAGGIPESVWQSDPYLEITINTETLSPRELIHLGLSFESVTAQSAESLASQYKQISHAGWTPNRGVYSFVTELDTTIHIEHRSIVMLAYSGTLKCHDGSQDCYLKIYRDSTRLLDGAYVFDSTQPIFGQVIDVVDPGTYDYRVYIDSAQATTNYRLFGSSFSILTIPVN